MSSYTLDSAEPAASTDTQIKLNTEPSTISTGIKSIQNATSSLLTTTNNSSATPTATSTVSGISAVASVAHRSSSSPAIHDSKLTVTTRTVASPSTSASVLTAPTSISSSSFTSLSSSSSSSSFSPPPSFSSSTQRLTPVASSGKKALKWIASKLPQPKSAKSPQYKSHHFSTQPACIPSTTTTVTTTSSNPNNTNYTEFLKKNPAYWARKSNYHNNKPNCSTTPTSIHSTSHSRFNIGSNLNTHSSSITPLAPTRSVSTSDVDLHALTAKFQQSNVTHSLSLQDMIALNQHNQLQMNSRGVLLTSDTNGHSNGNSNGSNGYSSRSNDSGNSPNSSSYTKRCLNLERLLKEETVELDALRRASWNGLPKQYQSLVWKLLLNYLPLNRSRRAATLELRRAEYRSNVQSYYSKYDIIPLITTNTNTTTTIATATTISSSTVSDPPSPGTPLKPSHSHSTFLIHQQLAEPEDDEILRQIKQDVPRTSGHLHFFKQDEIQSSLTRVLYVFSIRHPASGYVQGINDLATTFYYVYLYDYDISIDICLHNTTQVSLTNTQLFELECDVYWSLSNLLDSIQDNYTFAQPGIQRLIFKLQELIERLDGDLAKHLADNNLQFIHFSFRWVNCLLMRELSLPLIVRLWTTFLSEEEGIAFGFRSLLIYACAALLMKFSEQLKKMEFQDLVVFLQRLPTENWTDRDVEMLLAQAYLYKAWFHKSSHIQ